MPQNGKASPASPPFASPAGKPAASGGGSGGGHDFTKDNTSHSPATGGRDFTKENRPQSEAEGRAPGQPNTEGVPAGGKLPLMNPSPNQQSKFGARGPEMKPPFKLNG